MQGGALPYRRRVRLQLRASNMRAPYGLTYWSDPVQLDSLGGAAVVSVPCPSAAPSSALHNPRATYMLSIMANQARNPPALAGLRFCIDAVHVKLRLILDETVEKQRPKLPFTLCHTQSLFHACHRLLYKSNRNALHVEGTMRHTIAPCHPTHLCISDLTSGPCRFLEWRGRWRWW